MFMGGAPGKGQARVKIVDFGCARRFKPFEKMSDVYGSSNFVAPEMLKGEYDCKVDVFSTGVLLFSMLFQRLPFDGENDKIILEKIKTHTIDF